ncbi:hypothetical protein AB0L41_48275 [Amycolatopsis mediterranei]|uniref:hypothetical protein n=1 Tax=Amycolatopsis mediterranei TaxID=33910 RepID=UPI00342C70EA
MNKLAQLGCAAAVSVVMGFVVPVSANATDIATTSAPAGTPRPLIHACDNDFGGSRFYNSYLTCTNCMNAGQTLQGRLHWHDWDCSYNPGNGLWDLHYWS